MSDLKKYIKELNILKHNLTKFYYNSASEWLKPDILNCITSVNFEIALYTKENRMKTEQLKNSQITIFSLIKESD